MRRLLLQVKIEVETCEELRSPSKPADKKGSSKSSSSSSSGGQYGFADKVVDGVTVTVNSVHVVLRSKVFTASFQVSTHCIFR